MELRTSVYSGFFLDLSPEDAIDELARSSFLYTELDMGHSRVLLQRNGTPEQIGKDLRDYAADRGLTIPQGHLDNLDICIEEDLDLLKKHLELFHGIGIHAAVIHANGVPDLPFEEQLRLRSRALETLVHHIEGTDMVICVENLASKPMIRTAQGINTLIDAAGGGPHLGICLDIGHMHRCNCHGWTNQTATEFIRTAGSRLQALHVHDNLGDTDDHLFPLIYNGLDWKEFMTALSASSYTGLYNLEIPGESACPLEARRIKLRYAKELADYLLSDNFIA